MQKVFLFLLTLSILLLIFIWSMVNKKAELPVDSSSDESILISVGGTKIKAELADTPRKRVQGLSGRLLLGDDTGMLFVFEKEDFHGIWMKDMLFPIDIVWIDEGMVVIDVKRNTEPESYPDVFKPKDKAKYVLEVNAGFARSHDMEIGDKVSF